jgi:hypothetical protein
MPSALTYNLNNDKYNWDFYTTPQEHLNGRPPPIPPLHPPLASPSEVLAPAPQCDPLSFRREIHQPRGKTLGGSSSLNAMAYIRPSPPPLAPSRGLQHAEGGSMGGVMLWTTSGGRKRRGSRAGVTPTASPTSKRPKTTSTALGTTREGRARWKSRGAGTTTRSTTCVPPLPLGWVPHPSRPSCPSGRLLSPRGKKPGTRTPPTSTATGRRVSARCT